LFDASHIVAIHVGTVHLFAHQLNIVRQTHSPKCAIRVPGLLAGHASIQCEHAHAISRFAPDLMDIECALTGQFPYRSAKS
jgi:hypothetical protein